MPDGLKTAVDLVMSAASAAEREPDQEPEQIDLEDLLGLPRPAPGADTLPAERRGPGRPAGSRNKRTIQWVDYLLRRYASPLEVLAQMATTPTDELKKALGCSALEAFQEKRHAAIALAPFLHQRQPLALNITERKAVYLTISMDKPDSTARDSESITIAATLVKEDGTDMESQGQSPTSD